jgi:hypothetical protein
MSLFKRIAAAGIEGAGHDAYWLSQLRMLQILERTRKNPGQISPRIEYLRQQDADLGGERFEPEFDRLSNKFGGRTSQTPSSP